MRQEAAAMLRAVVRDFLALPELSVTTFHGAGVPDLLRSAPALTRITTSSEAHLQQQLHRIAGDVDAVMLVAPESDGILETLLNTVQGLPRSGTHPLLLNLDVDRTRLFADKFATWQWLAAQGLPGIPTRPIDDDVAEMLLRSPVGSRHGDSVLDSAAAPTIVVKPRDGVGSHGVRIVRDARVSWSDLPDGGPDAKWIAQPFVSGESSSFGLIGGELADQTTILPAAVQCIHNDGTSLHYRGGVVPAAARVCGVVEPLARRMAAALGGFRGYVGVDVIVDAQLPERSVIVEVNPRLCTSFVGYQALAEEHLAARFLGMLSPRNCPVRWKSGHLAFDGSGNITPLSEMTSVEGGSGRLATAI